MNERHGCTERESLVTYLYGEGDEVERRRIERHLGACVACAADLDDLRGTQQALGEWRVPDAPLGFRIPRDPSWRGAFRAWRPAAWLPAAAALLLIAGAAAIANLEVRYGGDGLVVRTGWQTRPLPATASVPAAAESAWRTELVALEQRLRAEVANSRPAAVPASRAVSSVPPVGLESGSASEAALLRRVRAMVLDSERKQQQELALRMAQLVRDLDVQRRADLTRIEQSFGQIEGQTGAALAQQREWLNRFVRVSSSQR